MRSGDRLKDSAGEHHVHAQGQMQRQVGTIQTAERRDSVRPGIAVREVVAAELSKGREERPKNLRPLSLSNTDVKILALALNSMVAPVLPDWARREQQGFINDRLSI